MGKSILIFGLTCLTAWGADWKRAEELYQRTEYRASLETALSEGTPTAAGYGLIGRDYFMLGEQKKAIDAFQKALALEPNSSEYNLWLGRAYGRKAETANPLLAPSIASKARQYFERAVQLDPANEEALNDLFEYYLEAPGFLGGGFDKALDVAKRIRQINPAEYYFAEAQVAERRKEYNTAEEHLRRALALAPRQVGRVLDLASYLAKMGRYKESDAAFQEAERLAPNSPKVLFARAHTYVETRRNLDQAKRLLEQYLRSNLTPDDPPREEATRLLKRCGSTDLTACAGSCL
jgi:tetratricopeptide (TPR) repeat protein